MLQWRLNRVRFVLLASWRMVRSLTLLELNSELFNLLYKMVLCLQQLLTFSLKHLNLVDLLSKLFLQLAIDMPYLLHLIHLNVHWAKLNGLRIDVLLRRGDREVKGVDLAVRRHFLGFLWLEATSGLWRHVSHEWFENFVLFDVFYKSVSYGQPQRLLRNSPKLKTLLLINLRLCLKFINFCRFHITHYLIELLCFVNQFLFQVVKLGL